MVDPTSSKMPAQADLAPEPPLMLDRLAVAIEHLAGAAAALANHFVPQQTGIVGTPYVAKRMGDLTTVWVADLARAGRIPKSCIIPGSGHGKPWRFYRDQIDRWIESR